MDVTTGVTTPGGGERDALLVRLRAVEEFQRAFPARLERIEQAVAAR